MSTLNNSLWSVSCKGTEAGTDVVKFFPDGKAVAAFPDGRTAKGCWAEAPDGMFIFQTNCSSHNPDVNQVYIGVHGDDVATGYFSDINNLCCCFTMTKES